jgi:uncharacterized protein (TIGR02611 family)
VALPQARVSEEEPSRASRIAERIAVRREAHRKRSTLYRIAFMVAGLAVTAAGIAMLVLPGPALVVIPVGLAMLALEFAWAERALGYALARAERAQRTAQAASPLQKALSAAALAAAAAAFVVLAILYDIPLLPV